MPVTVWAWTHGMTGMRTMKYWQRKVVSELKQLAEKADHIYLATDLDREGGSHCRHLREVIGGDEQRYSRVVCLYEITKNATPPSGLGKAGRTEYRRVNAQQARQPFYGPARVGYVWFRRCCGKNRPWSFCRARAVRRGPPGWWSVNVKLKRSSRKSTGKPTLFTTLGGDALPLQVTHKDDKPFRWSAAMRPWRRYRCWCQLQRVLEREDKPTSSKPGALFITSTPCSRRPGTRLGFGVKDHDDGSATLRRQAHHPGAYRLHQPESGTLNMVRGYISDKFGKNICRIARTSTPAKKTSQRTKRFVRLM